MPDQIFAKFRYPINWRKNNLLWWTSQTFWKFWKFSKCMLPYAVTEKRDRRTVHIKFCEKFRRVTPDTHQLNSLALAAASFHLVEGGERKINKKKFRRSNQTRQIVFGRLSVCLSVCLSGNAGCVVCYITWRAELEMDDSISLIKCYTYREKGGKRNKTLRGLPDRPFLQWMPFQHCFSFVRNNCEVFMHSMHIW